MSIVNRERPALALPRILPWWTDSSRYFWRDGVLDSMWRRHWEDSSYGAPARTKITTSRFTWRNGLPVARYDETSGEIDGCIRETRWSATYRRDTLVELVDTTSYRAEQGASCQIATNITKTAWHYRPDTIETWITSYSGDIAQRTTLAGRFFALRPDGQVELQIYSNPDSLAPGWWLVRREQDLVLAWDYDTLGRQAELLVTGSFGTIRQAYHYDEPPPIPVRLQPSRSRIEALRIVGGQALFELARPTSVSVALFAPDGRAISLARNLSLAAGPQSFALPADLPRGVWIVRIQGAGVDLAAPWINAGR